MATKFEPNIEKEDNPEYDSLPKEDQEFLKEIDDSYTHETFLNLTLDIAAEELIQRLKGLHNKELEVFKLSGKELDAADILTQSGEACLYRNNNDHLCISLKYTLLDRLLGRLFHSAN